MNAGFVGYNKDGHFVHYCACGKWGDFGYDVHLLKGQLGKWYCREHRPVGDLTAPPSPLPPPSAPEPKVPAAVADDDRADRDLQMLLDL